MSTARSLRWLTLAFGILLFTLVLSHSAQAAPLTVQLGDQDFTDGQILTGGVPQFDAASAGEPAPFNAFRGSDLDANNPFSATWTFNFASGSYNSASITFGIYDHDAQAPGSQVSFFGFDGNDLTSLLNTAFESGGGAQAQYNVFTIDIPASMLAALNDGTATFTLTLQGPGLGSGDVTLPGNGAGLDFSRLTVNTPTSAVPEPTTMLLLGTGLAGIAVKFRKRKKDADSTET